MCERCNTATTSVAGGDTLAGMIRGFETRLRALEPRNFHELCSWLALEQAMVALEQGDYGIGAVIAVGEKIVVADRNRVITKGDPTSHAEMNALAKARELGVSGGVMYGTLEWCPQCFQATLTHGNYVTKAYSVAEDPGNGMLWLKNHGIDPKVWDKTLWAMLETLPGRELRMLTDGEVRDEFRRLSWDAFNSTREFIDLKLGAATPKDAIEEAGL